MGHDSREVQNEIKENKKTKMNKQLQSAMQACSGTDSHTNTLPSTSLLMFAAAVYLERSHQLQKHGEL